MTIPVAVFIPLMILAAIGAACLTVSTWWYRRARATSHHLEQWEATRQHLLDVVIRVSARHQNGDPS